MRPVLRVAGLSFASWLACSAFLERRTSFEVLCGMFAPLLSVTVTWALTERVYQRRPAALTSLMVTAFAAKLVFFGAYVTVMLRVLSLRPVPFVASFTSYFIVLYLIEALYLRRLFW